MSVITLSIEKKQHKEKLVLPKDILQSMPLGTKRKLENIKDNADYSLTEAGEVVDLESSNNGDIADLLLAIISAGNAVNVFSENFENLMNWMISQSIITQNDVNSLKNLDRF